MNLVYRVVFVIMLSVFIFGTAVGMDFVFDPIPSGSTAVDAVVAGDGLTGGGSSGEVSLAVLLDSNGGIEIIDDSLNIKLNGSNLALSSDGLTTGSAVTLDSEWDSISEINIATTDADIISTSSAWSGGDLGGTGLAASVTDDSHSHTGSTISGIDISSDTNLKANTEIVLTGDSLYIANSIMRSDAVGDSILSLAYSPNSNAVADSDIVASITRDSEWDSAAEINAATTDADFLTTWTAFDDIVDPDADGTIAFGSYEQTLSTSLDALNKSALTINHTDASVSNATTLLRIQTTSNDDTDLTYLSVKDDSGGSPDELFKIWGGGIVTFGSAASFYPFGNDFYWMLEDTLTFANNMLASEFDVVCSADGKVYLGTTPGGYNDLYIGSSGNTVTVTDTFNIGSDDNIEHQIIHDAGTLVFKDDSDDTQVIFGPVANGTSILDVTGTIDADALKSNGNAVLTTASEWTGGDLGGTGLAASVTDYSHNHVISNVDNLGDSLAAKVNSITAGDGLLGGGSGDGAHTLSVAIDIAGGLETVDDSLNVKLDGVTLSSSSSGLKVSTVVGVTGADADAVSLTDVQTATTNDFHNIGGVDDDTPDSDSEVPDAITVGASGSVNDAAIPSGITRDAEWDSVSEINAVTSDADIIATNSSWTGGDLGGTGLAASVIDDSHNHIYSNIDTTTSANWASIVSNETGEGLWVFGTNPSFTANLNTPQITFSDADSSPNAVGEILYDNTVAGLDDGAFAWYDDDEVRYLVDLDTAPSNDEYVVGYDAGTSRFYMKEDATGVASLPTVSTKTANYTALTSDDIILCNAVTGSFTISLPAVATSAGILFYIKKIDSSVNSVTVDPNGSETIDGALTQIITDQYVTITIVCDGSNWYIL